MSTLHLYNINELILLQHQMIMFIDSHKKLLLLHQICIVQSMYVCGYGNSVRFDCIRLYYHRTNMQNVEASSMLCQVSSMKYVPPQCTIYNALQSISYKKI